MKATQSILKTWEKFNDFHMETLTKCWWFHNSTGSKKQRTVSLMNEHREQYAMSGNCFDLALWLLDEFKKDGVNAYPIADHLTDDAHAAVIAVSEDGNKYYCDLGDQWIQPILIDADCEDFTNKKLVGFFPGAHVQVNSRIDEFEILYHRPNGKISKQSFNAQPVEMKDFLQAAEHSQNIIHSKPLYECRLPYNSEIAHWEFYNWESFLSTNDGLFPDSKLESVEDWADRLYKRTGYNRGILLDVLERYKRM